MNFNLQPTMMNGQAAPTFHPQLLPSGGIGSFAEQALLRAGYPGLSNIRYFPNPIDSGAAIQREIEKERTREEIILAEIVRRRMFDEELRRELMLERHAALNRVDGFLSSSSMFSNHRSNSYLPPSETRSLEERLILSFEKRSEFPVPVRRSEGSSESSMQFQSFDKRSEFPVPSRRFEGSSSESMQFQRSSEHRVSTLNLLPAGASEERHKSIQFQPTSEPRVSTVNLLPLEPSEEKIKSMQFQCTSESRVSTVNLLPEGTSEGKPKSMDKPQVNHFGLKRKADSPLLIGDDEPTSATLSKKTALKNERDFCSLCQVGATSKENLNDHLKGKKHKANELKLRQKEEKNYEIGLFPKTAVEKQEMNPNSVVGEKNNNLPTSEVPLKSQKKMIVHKKGKKKYLRNHQLLQRKGRAIPPSV